MSANAVLHIPHSTTTIPPDVRETLVLSNDALARELQLITDLYTDELFAPPDAAIEVVRFPVSRLVVDPERFVDDSREPMARRGMGVIYTCTSDGLALREPPTPDVRDNLLGRYYVPHHRRLLQTVDAALLDHGHAVILDCHSFPPRSLPCHDYQDQGTPDICLGTDDFHTPPSLLELARRVFEAAGYSVMVNWPFSGALVPSEHYHRARAVTAIIIELNRRCYLDERGMTKSATFAAIAARFQEAVLQLIRGAHS